MLILSSLEEAREVVDGEASPRIDVAGHRTLAVPFVGALKASDRAVRSEPFGDVHRSPPPIPRPEVSPSSLAASRADRQLS